MLESALLSQALLLAFALQCLAMGFIAASTLGLWAGLPPERDSTFLRAFLSLSVGLALNIAILFTTGLLAILNFAEPVALGALALLVAAPVSRRSALEAAKAQPPHAADLAMMALLFLATAPLAIRPPGLFDDTMYHLPLARFYAEHHAIALDVWARFPLFPQNMELLCALALGLRPGDAVLAQGMATLPAFGVGLGLIGASVALRSSRWPGAIAGAVYIGMKVVQTSLGYAYVEFGLAMFSWAAELGAVLIAADASVGAFLLLGMLAGAAAGCKIFGAPAAGLVFLTLAARRCGWKSLAVFAAATVLFGGGWYLRSFLISGDPIHPAGGPWFGYFLWNEGDYAGQKSEQLAHGVARVFWNMPMGLIKGGANLLIPALIAPLVARGRTGPALMLWLMFAAYTLLWFYFAQIDRYLAPVHAAGALLAVFAVFDLLSWAEEALTRLTPGFVRLRAAAVDGRAGRLARLPWASTLTALLLLAGAIRAGAFAKYEIAHWRQGLEQQGGFAAFEKADALAPKFGTKLVQILFENESFFFDGEAIGDHFGPGRYRQFWSPDRPGHLVSPERMQEILAGFGARMLIAPAAMIAEDRDAFAQRFDLVFMDATAALLTVKDAGAP